MPVSQASFPRGIWMVILLLLIAGYLSPLHADAATLPSFTGWQRERDFHQYLEIYNEMEVLRSQDPDDRVVIPAASYFEAGGGVELQADGGVFTDEASYVEWGVFLEQPGLYNIAITYYPIDGRRSTIQRELLLNDQRPYLEAGYLEFHRVWGDAAPPKVDNQGNVIRATQVEKPIWRRVLLTDSMGVYRQPLSFYFQAGYNTLRLVSRREPMVIRSIEILPLTESPDYSTVYQSYREEGISKTSGLTIKVQGQDAVYRSNPSLFPICDRSDPTVEPYHHTLIRLNTTGGERWSQPGDWITWEFDVPQAGLYKLGVKAKQHTRRGSYSSRRLWVNEQVPFKEVEAVKFPYSARYQMIVPGEGDAGEPYLFYFKEGKNTITLENVLGDLAPILRATQASLYELNTIYRRIVMITSPNPDPMRDYQLQERIPDLIARLRTQSEVIWGLARELEALSGQVSAQVAILDQLSRSLQIMADRPETIPRRLDAFRDNSGALGTWILQAREQPLQIDYILIASADQDLPEAQPTMNSVLLHETRSFLASFIHDYTLIGDVYDEKRVGQKLPLRVWIGSGRDQAQILKLMIEDSFTPYTGIPVNLELINIGILLPATLAGRGPDIALGVQSTQPMDFALRGAAVDLAGFEDFPTVAKRFHASALAPYAFHGSVYALPETQSFSMLFYRKDILAELGLEVPNTWDDVIQLIPDLNKEHMDFGLPYTGVTQASSGAIGESSATMSVIQHGGVSTYLTLLYQQDTELYRQDGIATNLDTEAAVDAFIRWTELYELYDLPLWYDAANRFRMGEMPVLIADFGLYNFLSVFAPELRGEWGFTLVPGTLQPDGTVDRSVPVGGPGAMMLDVAKNKDDAWEFLKWWTSAETQARFGRELESLMGPAARYASANLEAVRELPWTVDEYQLLEEQRSWAKGVPNVPGAYMVGRHLDNAFRRVIYHNEPARDTLLDYNRVMNDEIRLKRLEFGLEVEE